jgi:signal transduction histidine kinase
LRSDARATAALHAWDAASSSWYEQFAQPTIRDVTAHGVGAVSTKQVLAGKALFDANRAKFNVFSNRLVAKRNAASHSLQVRTTLLFVAVLVLVAALAVAGALSWLGLRRWVLIPLASLGKETRLVRGGRIDHEVAVEGPAEIQELATDVDDMRRDIVEKLETVERARVEIEAARVQVEAQAQDLARSNRDLEQFAYVASHDLQEPLRKVASFCQMLERRYSDQLDERASQYIAFAVDGAKRMQQLINDLLTFSRVGRVESPMVDVDLQACFATATDNLSVAVEASGATVSAHGLPHVLGVPNLLIQLLQNLVANAIKFRGEDAPYVTISARRDGGFWELSCADNGLGIEPQYAERIFVIFQRLHGKDEYTGTGIGLALCKRIVEFHGGRIWLDQSPAGGATFRWTLRAYADPVTEPAVRSSVETP